MVARGVRDAEVVGSNPATPTMSVVIDNEEQIIKTGKKQKVALKITGNMNYFNNCSSNGLVEVDGNENAFSHFKVRLYKPSEQGVVRTIIAAVIAGVIVELIRFYVFGIK